MAPQTEERAPFNIKDIPAQLSLLIGEWEARKYGQSNKQGVPPLQLDCRAIHFYTWTTYDLLKEAKKKGVAFDPETQKRAETLMDESNTIAWPGRNDPILSDRYTSYCQAELNDKQ